MNFQRLTGEIKRLEALLAKSLAKAAAATVVQNAADTLQVTVGPAASVTFTSVNRITVGKSGTVYLSASVTAGVGGGTAVNGELLQFSLDLDGAPIAGQSTTQALAGDFASSTPLGVVTGLTPGSSHTFGVTVTNSSTPAHTQALVSGGTTAIAWSP